MAPGRRGHRTSMKKPLRRPAKASSKKKNPKKLAKDPSFRETNRKQLPYKGDISHQVITVGRYLPVVKRSSRLYQDCETHLDVDHVCRERYRGLSINTVEAVRTGLGEAAANAWYVQAFSSCQLYHIRDVAKMVGSDAQRKWIWPDGSSANMRQYAKKWGLEMKDIEYGQIVAGSGEDAEVSDGEEDEQGSDAEDEDMDTEDVDTEDEGMDEE